MLNGKEDETVGVCSEKRFRGKESFLFGNPVLRWWVERGGGGGGFSCGTGCIGAKFMPVIAVVADEVGDFAEGLVRHSVLEGHGSGMGGDAGSGGGDPLWVKVLVSEESSSVGESESSESDS